MKRGRLLLIALCGLFWGSDAWPQSLDSLIDRQIGSLVAVYKSLHETPELSGHEEITSTFMAKELRSLGFEVTGHVGKYRHPGWTAYGVVGVMKNGSGPTVLVRTELDALPVTERTGLAYASKVRTRDDAGQEVDVMHACGHDLHMTSFLGTARMLVELRNQWHGTLVMIGQPAEETIGGAEAMLEDGLYTRFPKPDYAIALHVNPLLEAGKAGYTPGYSLASSTAINISVHGIGGHGSAPQETKDPIVVAAQIVLALQTIVSREVSPFDQAVVTVGSIKGGSKNNIIPDEVCLLLTIRTYEENVRQHILASINRIAKNIALAGGIPEELAPEVQIGGFAPATYNDPTITERLSQVFKKALGADNVEKMNPSMASEDFGRLGLEGHQIPIIQFSLGATDPTKLAESKQTGKPVPGLHSSLFAPLPEPAIRAGVKATAAAVLDLMK